MLTKEKKCPKCGNINGRDLEALGYIQVVENRTCAEYHHKSRKQDGFRMDSGGTIIFAEGFVMVKLIHEAILRTMIQKGWW